MTLSPQTIARIAARRNRELDLVRAEMDRQFEFLDDNRLYIRRMDVARAIAPFLGREPQAALLEDVVVVAKVLGWKINKSWNRSLFKGVKPRRLSLRDAVKESRELWGTIGRRSKAPRQAPAGLGVRRPGRQ